jgi:hypothetical protein
MPILTFKNADGEYIKVNSPDGSTPPDAVLDKLFDKQKSLKGGATSPANVQAQSDLKDAQFNASPVGRFGQNLKIAADPALAVGNSALLGMPGGVSKLMSGGKMVNPLTHGLNTVDGGKNVLDLGTMSEGQKTATEMGGALVPIGGALKSVGNLVKFGKEAYAAKTVGLAKEVRSAATSAHTQAVAEFGGQLDQLSQANPTRSVSIREVIDNINAGWQDMASEAKSIFRKTPILKDMMENPSLADNVSLKDTQKIINYINTKVPRNIRANHLDILDTLNDIRASQLDAFPEMEAVRAKYGDFKNAFNAIKGKLKEGSLIDNLSKNFGDAEIQDKAKKVFTQDMLDKVQKFRQTQQVLKAAGIATNWALKGAATVAGGGAIYEGGKTLMGH